MFSRMDLSSIDIAGVFEGIRGEWSTGRRRKRMKCDDSKVHFVETVSPMTGNCQPQPTNPARRPI